MPNWGLPLIAAFVLENSRGRGQEKAVEAAEADCPDRTGNFCHTNNNI
jgi:hypothetical protein